MFAADSEAGGVEESGVLESLRVAGEAVSDEKCYRRRVVVLHRKQGILPKASIFSVNVEGIQLRSKNGDNNPPISRSGSRMSGTRRGWRLRRRYLEENRLPSLKNRIRDAEIPIDGLKECHLNRMKFFNLMS